MDLNPETYRPYRMSVPPSRDRGFRWLPSGWLLWLALLVMIVIAEQGIAHGISTNGAVNAAQAMGYTDVKITDRHTILPSIQGCGTDDLVKFDITGTDLKGMERSFFVCDGIFKGATVRFN